MQLCCIGVCFELILEVVLKMQKVGLLVIHDLDVFVTGKSGDVKTFQVLQIEVLIPLFVLLRNKLGS
jgi:hypothetical protein